MGIDLVVLRLSSMDGFHIQSMTEDKGNTFFPAEIGNPVPGKHALDRHHEILTVWLDRPEKGSPVGIHVPVEFYFPFRIEDAQVHFSCMEIDSAIEFVLTCVKVHKASSLLVDLWFLQTEFTMFKRRP
ncbi:MAG: hypothetical protein A4E62_01795 [Syntrophorhabdus sp. PtaU1.Bin002]|nr:MAG: hypothetical protein A4E62_01795 [Syntrophorhabdus sp. PtaU1.Bin002]